MGWEAKNNAMYFKGKDGKYYTGWHQMGTAEGERQPHWSYFGNDGKLRTLWQQMGTPQNPDGNKAKHWSYFGSNGWLRLGWQRLGRGTANPDGNSAAHWSYFGNDGWLRTGLQEMGKGTKNPDGDKAKHLSYFGDNGWLVTNKIVTVGGKKYQANADGWLTLIPANTYSTFIKARIGKKIDKDGRYGVQCVDLIKDYLDVVFGIKAGAWGDAHAYYDNYSKHPELVKNFDKIANTPNFVPRKGDIVIWSRSMGGTGHIAIATGEGNVSYFYAYDQNWGYAHEGVTRHRHDYSKFLGVLRPKNQALAA